jgi:hypothetical protein
MFRIDNSCAATILPTPLAPGTPGFFSSGNIGGELATIVTADFMNQVQEGLVAVVNAAGLTLDKTDNTQVITAILALIGKLSRRRLTGPLDLYCAPGGSDTNNGLSPSTPFATLTAAYNLLVQQYDLGGQTVTIHLADGNYPPVALNGAPLGMLNPSNIVFLGNVSNPANVQINQSTALQNAFSLSYFGACTLNGMEISAPASQANCIIASFGSKIFAENLIYGTAGSYHNWSQWGSTIAAAGNYTINGGAAAHIFSDNSGQSAGELSTLAATIALVGTPHFSTAFVYATNSSMIEFDSTNITFSGAATGSRYLVNHQSAIYVPSGSATYFPGDTAGVADAATFGLYTT